MELAVRDNQRTSPPLSPERGLAYSKDWEVPERYLVVREATYQPVQVLAKQEPREVSSRQRLLVTHPQRVQVGQLGASELYLCRQGVDQRLEIYKGVLLPGVRRRVREFPLVCLDVAK